MRLRRKPHPALAPYIKEFWYSDQISSRTAASAHREHNLPSGNTHLVFRLSNRPLRTFRNNTDLTGSTLGFAVVGGPSACYYIKEVSNPVSSVGAVLRPGASLALFDCPANELSGQHISLDNLWGEEADRARTRLLEQHDPAEKLNLFESLLAARLRFAHGIHPAVAVALAQLDRGALVRNVVRDSGFSHRRFIELFRRDVGLTPKLYCRVRRFSNALLRFSRNPNQSVVDLAISAGFSDQSHFNREFLEFAGVTPGEYHKIKPQSPHHVPVL